jgi:hypothetical protein
VDTSTSQAKDVVVDLVEADRHSAEVDHHLEAVSASEASHHLVVAVEVLVAAMAVTEKCLTLHVQTVASHARYRFDQTAKSQYFVMTVLQVSEELTKHHDDLILVRSAAVTDVTSDHSAKRSEILVSTISQHRFVNSIQNLMHSS